MEFVVWPRHLAHSMWYESREQNGKQGNYARYFPNSRTKTVFLSQTTKPARL